MSKIATRAGLNRQQLYRTLSSAGNPKLRSLTWILEATGLQLVVTAKPINVIFDLLGPQGDSTPLPP